MVCVCGCLGTYGLVQSAPRRSVLLNVQEGQVPPDTGLDDKTRPEIVEGFAGLGGRALKVPFFAGDSFGSRGGANKDWSGYSDFRFSAFVPGKERVQLELDVIHGGSSNYQTRVVVPIALMPGKSDVKLPLDRMKNVNGSAPDLTRIARWYLYDVESKGPLVYFTDIYLEGEGKPAAVAADAERVARPTVAAPAPGESTPPMAYQITGTIGGYPVNLTVTPRLAGAPVAAGQGPSGSPPPIDKAVPFNTPEADRIASALQVFPPDNPWNVPVDSWPVDPNSEAIVRGVGDDKPLRYNPDMGFVFVPPNQKKVPVKIVEYPGESDKGPFPVPDNVPLEGWPINHLGPGGKLRVTLDEMQRDPAGKGGDRHAIVVDPVSRMLYEFYEMKRTARGWEAGQASVFDLKTNDVRPEGWTSADAAGLPIFPAVVRYDELQAGLIRHAMRVTIRKTRREYVYPARHYASKLTDSNLPRMGERFRLRASFDVAGFSPEVRVILNGLKKYGMIVADNGIEWAISVTPDERIKWLHEELRRVKGSDFEVVKSPSR